jgi:hypothetical protein
MQIKQLEQSFSALRQARSLIRMVWTDPTLISVLNGEDTQNKQKFLEPVHLMRSRIKILENEKKYQFDSLFIFIFIFLHTLSFLSLGSWKRIG